MTARCTTSAGRVASGVTLTAGVSALIVQWQPYPGEPEPAWPFDEQQLTVAQHVVALMRNAWPEVPVPYRSDVDRGRLRLVARATIPELLRIVTAVECADLEAARDCVALIRRAPGGGPHPAHTGVEAAHRGREQAARPTPNKEATHGR